MAGAFCCHHGGTINIDDTQEIEVGTPGEDDPDAGQGEPGMTEDPEHGLPGEAEELPEGDAEREA